MSEDAMNPYSPPASDPLPVVLEAPRFRLASPWVRLWSSIIDTILQLSAFYLVRILLFLTGVVPSIHPHIGPGKWDMYLSSLLGMVLFLAVQWRWLSRGGQTIGKKLTGIRIVTMQGEKPSMATLVLKRYGFVNVIVRIPFAGNYLALVDVLCIFRADRRCLHDHVAGTQVVEVVTGTEPEKADN